ncbi:MAG: hypothetical protein EXS50_03265 [Candidatus Taylorbacteria bacterium]|nr:hypothetical protein [Candidatus Taylorbacteria bacterium]
MCNKTENNAPLAYACREASTWCCKDGFIFLPRVEYEAIIAYLVEKPDALADFSSRIIDHGDFLLYDQKTRCQFLRENETCELFSLGIRPTECFWWPAHVYLDDRGELEIRVSKCCTACKYIESGSDFLAKVEVQARAIGLPLLTKFRRIHSYDVSYEVAKKIQ